MKVACFLLAVSTANAFAPARVSKASTALASELEGMNGVSAETGGKIVSLNYYISSNQFSHLIFSSILWVLMNTSQQNGHVQQRYLMDDQPCLQQ